MKALEFPTAPAVIDAGGRVSEVLSWVDIECKARDAAVAFSALLSSTGYGAVPGVAVFSSKLSGQVACFVGNLHFLMMGSHKHLKKS